MFEARSIEDEQVARVWDHFVETNHPVRKEMSPAQERMIRRVLKELTVEEAELAIDGNRQSSWHRERGRHSLSDVFKPNATKRETIRQKADRFINDAVRAGKGQRVLSVDRGKVERHQKVVLRAHQPGASEVIMERLGPSIAWLEENGIEVRIVDGWPHFIEKDG